MFLTPIYPPLKGGAAVHFEQITSGLIERGVIERAVVLTCFVSLSRAVERNESKTIFRLLIPPQSMDGPFPRIRAGYNRLITLFAVVVFVLLTPVSIVHTQTKRYYEWGVYIAKELGSTVVIEGQDLGSASFAARGDFFVAISKNVADAAKHRTERIVQAPVGIDFDGFPDPDSECRPTEEDYILYVGDVARRKGVDALLDAHRSLESEERLVIVGEVVDADLLSSIEGAGGVKYDGAVPHDTVIHYMANAELTVLPSREEAIGRVPIESFSVRTPCVCPPDVPEYQEYVPHLVLSRVTAEDIRRKMDELLSTEHVELSYPVERHRVENTMQHYVSMYRTHIERQ
ncbi:glycosyltransferase family 4 protein [Haloarcula sp. CBA1122]|uniref:glycosyltransferase family 4 protein n=1 Tax=Haloarcula sp. CBA1122 TaxID=2668069 RepID=UPI0018D240AD|nr:glycosyltransferase family 4 protein [Haloarcula sp. CBA1122]